MGFNYALLIRTREARGWSQKTLATAANLHPQQISKVERGANQYPPTIKKIADALGLSMSDVLNGGDTA